MAKAEHVCVDRKVQGVPVTIGHGGPGCEGGPLPHWSLERRLFPSPGNFWNFQVKKCNLLCIFIMKNQTLWPETGTGA